MKSLALVLCLCTVAAAQRRPEVQVIEAKARRVEEGKVAVDGRVKIGDKPLKGLVLVFDFLSSEGETLTSQKITADEDQLDRGEESSVHAVTMNPPGAIRFRLRAFDASDRQLRIGNAGPFVIE
jgi:hypothetical protein